MRRRREPLPPASGIVLAGGRASRFGRDKLLEPVDGRPLLARSVDRLAAVCTEVLVVAAPGASPPLAPDVAGTVIRVVHDPEAFGGPVVGTLAGLEQATEPLAIVVAGDMPHLAVPVLALLLTTLVAGEDEAAVLVLRGRRQPLPLAVRVGRATDVARRQLGIGDRRLAAMVDLLRVQELPDAAWRGLDPAARTLDDIDRPEDLR